MDITMQKSLSSNTNERLLKKSTTKGRIKEMNTLRVHREMFSTNDVILHKIFEARRIKSSNKCPKCGKAIDKFYKKAPGKQAFVCRNCFHKTYPLVGTPLERTHVSLVIILELTFRMIQSKNGFPAAAVERDYGIKEVAAWKTLHRIRRWMGIYLEQTPFEDDSYIEIDEVYPKKPTGLGRRFKWSRGMGSERIANVVTMVERGGLAKGFVVDTVDTDSINSLLNANVKKTNKLRTDEKRVYSKLNKEWDHAKANHHKKKWVVGDAHTNNCEGLHSFIKGNVYYTHKGVKYLQAYVDETAFRFSIRFLSVQEAIDELFKVLPPLFENQTDEILSAIIGNKNEIKQAS